MTLEEAIRECQKVVDECPWPGTVEEHKQLLAWLKDYQTMLSKPERTAKVTQVERGSATLLVWKCENCGQYMHRASWAREVNYCSHCGARLEWE